jgi:hypothetical protein
VKVWVTARGLPLLGGKIETPEWMVARAAEAELAKMVAQAAAAELAKAKAAAPREEPAPKPDRAKRKRKPDSRSVPWNRLWDVGSNYRDSVGGVAGLPENRKDMERRLLDKAHRLGLPNLRANDSDLWRGIIAPLYDGAKERRIREREPPKKSNKLKR